jgi:hypothetical protein
VKIYVAAMEALKKERQDETQVTTKIGGKFSFPVACLMPYYAKTGHSRPLIVPIVPKLAILAP